MPNLSALDEQGWAQALAANDMRTYAALTRLQQGPAAFAEIPSGAAPNMVKAGWIVQTDTGYELTELGKTVRV